MNCPECNSEDCQVCAICWQPKCRHHEFVPDVTPNEAVEPEKEEPK